MEFTELEKTILYYTQELVREEFPINSKCFYHYTNKNAAEAIVLNQSFHASFIRSTTDALEFAYPMAACRDILCRTHDFFSNVSKKLVKNLNEEASDPTARPYFISLSGEPNSDYLKSEYGDHIVEIINNTESTDFKIYGFFINCKYVADVKGEVRRLLQKWQIKALNKALSEHKVSDPQKRIMDWFYTLMQFCHTISLGIKQDSFQDEKETRIVVIPLTPDENIDWHDSRDTKPLSTKSLLNREFLPVKLNAMGIKAKRVTT